MWHRVAGYGGFWPHSVTTCRRRCMCLCLFLSTSSHICGFGCSPLWVCIEAQLVFGASLAPSNCHFNLLLYALFLSLQFPQDVHGLPHMRVLLTQLSCHAYLVHTHALHARRQRRASLLRRRETTTRCHFGRFLVNVGTLFLICKCPGDRLEML